MNKTIEKIKKQLLNLPGAKCQNIMKPSYRGELLKGDKKLDSAVMIILYYKNEELYTTIIKRSVYDGKHSGQMAFPGGKYENTDNNLIDTAIRETFEEVGVEIKKSDILGQLTSLIIPVSNILVTPVVSFINYIPNYTLDKYEVQKVYEVPIPNFINNIKIKHDIKYNTKVTIPYFDIKNEMVWGATAMIISELLEVLKCSQIL